MTDSAEAPRLKVSEQASLRPEVDVSKRRIVLSLLATIWTGIASSFTASLVWLFALRAIRPKILISPMIAYENPPSGMRQYTVKLVNLSRNAAVDVRVELVAIQAQPTQGGQVMNRTYLDLAEPNPLLIQGTRHRKSSPWNLSAYRIRTSAPLHELMGRGGENIRVRVHAKHGISGIGRTFERYFHHPESELISGRFVRGRVLEVVPHDPGAP